MEDEILFMVFELQDRLKKLVPLSLRDLDGFNSFLTYAELFKTKRAEKLPAEAHEIWQTIITLDPSEAEIQIGLGPTPGHKVTPEEERDYLAQRIAAANVGY